jgi:hypothetical protein
MALILGSNDGAFGYSLGFLTTGNADIVVV